MKVIYSLILLFICNQNLLVASNPILYVNHAATGANNGSSWNDAFNSLQSALNIATSGSEIWVAKGTYYPSQDYDWGDDSDPRLY